MAGSQTPVVLDVGRSAVHEGRPGRNSEVLAQVGEAAPVVPEGPTPVVSVARVAKERPGAVVGATARPLPKRT